MRRQRHNRGATLIEVLISLAVVLVGMLAMFKVLATSISGSASASRLSQAEARALTILESIRHSPRAALACLASQPPTSWASCEQVCQSALTATTPRYDACIYTIARLSVVPSPTGDMGLTIDRNLQSYWLDSQSRVTVAGANNYAYDIDLYVGWNDDNSSSTDAGYHTVHLRTGVFPVDPTP